MFAELDLISREEKVWKRSQCHCKQENILFFIRLRSPSRANMLFFANKWLFLRNYFSAWCASKESVIAQKSQSFAIFRAPSSKWTLGSWPVTQVVFAPPPPSWSSLDEVLWYNVSVERFVRSSYSPLVPSAGFLAPCQTPIYVKHSPSGNPAT